jgi:flagellar M-ring protein FliF
MASVFHSAEERAQGVRKREWEEMEKMLEELDFVVGARVRSSPGAATTFLGGPATATTASVTLRVEGGAELTDDQARTVANLVSRGLGIAKEDLMISDQAGRSLYDGEESRGDERDVEDLLAHQTEYDARLSSEATAVLEDILGPNKARVTVSSEWDFAQSTTRIETAQKGPVVQETTTTSEKPVSLGAAGGGEATGVSANTLDPDSPASTIEGETPAVEPLLEKTSEQRKEYAPSTTHEERVRYVPELERLSVALFLDQSVDPARKADLESAIKASVGFDEERDAFESVVLAFVPPPAPEPSTAPEEAPAAPSPWLELLLQRGLEIASGLVFLVLLLKTLKSARKPAAASAAGRAAAAAEDSGVDTEMLARVQVEELLKSDPSRVGEILSKWAREEPAQARS